MPALAWKKACDVELTGFYILCNLESDDEFPDAAVVLIGRQTHAGKLFVTAYGGYQMPLNHYDNEFFLFMGPVPPVR